MNNLKLIVVAVALFVAGFSTNHFAAKTRVTESVRVLQDPRADELETQLARVRAQDEADERLGQYAINMMYKTSEGRKLSDGKKLILARAIVRVSNDIFETEDHKKAFVAVLAIESQFARFAQSPTGPKGYAQLARASFHEAMRDCGVTDLKDEDVWETDLNLYAGACYFRKMMEQNGNDPYIAIVAYNQGPNDSSIKTFAKTGHLEKLEPLKYVARFTFYKRTTTDQVVPGVPAMGDLPKPQPQGLKVELAPGKVESGTK